MASSERIELLKMNGAGNKILVADFRSSGFRMTGKLAEKIGKLDALHFDQMMVMYSAKDSALAAEVTIYNIDGSKAEACGNGTRCIAETVFGDDGSEALFLTEGGLIKAWRADDELISVDMGKPRLRWDEIPLAEEFADTRAIELQVGPIDAPVLHSPSVVNMGNPHAIFWVGDVEAHGLERIGPVLENHPVFPERANISLAAVTAPDAMTLKVWERGTGLTLACGSAACAAVVASVRTERTGRNVKVSLPGGDLNIEWREDGHVIMTGPTEFEFAVSLDPETLEFERLERAA